jgi:hypothetical protein
MGWVEIEKAKITNREIDRCFALLHNEYTALAMVSLLRDGRITLVYSLPGKKKPECEQGFATEEDAKQRAEEVVRSKIILPKVALLTS